MAFDTAPYGKDYMETAQNLAKKPFTPFGQRTAGASQNQRNGWEAMYNRGSQGAAEVNDARTQLRDTINGGGFKSNPFLSGSNPYLQNQIDGATSDLRRSYESTLPSMSSTAARGASFGGGRANNYELDRERVYADQVGKTTGNMRFTDFEGQRNAWENERNRQMQATLGAPQFSQVDYQDINSMINAGKLEQNQRQNEINGNLAEYQNAQEWPFRTFGVYSQAMGNGGGFQPQQAKPDRVSQAAGLLGLGKSLFDLF